jgi:2'-5' RNA ligase
VRLFLASWLGADNQAFYGELVAGLSARTPGVVRGVPAESVHLTCAFFPDVPEEGVGTLLEAVEDVARAHRAFAIGLGSPRIRWGGRAPRLIEVPVISGDGDYDALAAALAMAIRRAWPGLSFRPSRAPHATIARFRKQATRAAAQALAIELTAPGRSDRVDAIAVVASVLSSQGPRYEIKARVPLAG